MTCPFRLYYFLLDNIRAGAKEAKMSSIGQAVEAAEITAMYAASSVIFSDFKEYFVREAPCEFKILQAENSMRVDFLIIFHGKVIRFNVLPHVKELYMHVTSDVDPDPVEFQPVAYTGDRRTFFDYLAKLGITRE